MMKLSKERRRQSSVLSVSDTFMLFNHVVLQHADRFRNECNNRKIVYIPLEQTSNMD